MTLAERMEESAEARERYRTAAEKMLQTLHTDHVLLGSRAGRRIYMKRLCSCILRARTAEGAWRLRRLMLLDTAHRERQDYGKRTDSAEPRHRAYKGLLSP